MLPYDNKYEYKEKSDQFHHTQNNPESTFLSSARIYNIQDVEIQQCQYSYSPEFHSYMSVVAVLNYQI